MSLQLIQEYHHKVQEILQYGGSRNETTIRPAFQKLLEQYCADKNIELILELEYKTSHGTTVYPDGTLKDALGGRLIELHIGYEKADPYPLKRIDRKSEPGKPPPTVKPILKADKTPNTIQLDSMTTLQGVPPTVWEYRLGNRSQRTQTQRPNGPRKVRHVPLCRPQGTGHRPAPAGLHGQRRNDGYY